MWSSEIYWWKWTTPLFVRFNVTPDMWSSEKGLDALVNDGPIASTSRSINDRTKLHIIIFQMYLDLVSTSRPARGRAKLMPHNATIEDIKFQRHARLMVEREWWRAVMDARTSAFQRHAHHNAERKSLRRLFSSVLIGFQRHAQHKSERKNCGVFVLYHPQCFNVTPDSWSSERPVQRDASSSHLVSTHAQP
jgi:hypothetical protein